MTTNLAEPKGWNHLAIVSMVLGLISFLLSIFSSWEWLIEINYLNDNFSELGNGRLWEEIPQVHLSVCCGGLIVGITACVIGIISLVRMRKQKMSGRGLAVMGIIFGCLGFIISPLLFVLSFLLEMLITG